MTTGLERLAAKSRLATSFRVSGASLMDGNSGLLATELENLVFPYNVRNWHCRSRDYSAMLCYELTSIVQTIKRNGILIFTSRAVKEKCDGPVYIPSEFGITYIGEKDSRVAWELKRKGSMNFKQVESEFPLKYGDRLPRFETRVEPMEIRAKI